MKNKSVLNLASVVYGISTIVYITLKMVEAFLWNGVVQKYLLIPPLILGTISVIAWGFLQLKYLHGEKKIPKSYNLLKNALNWLFPVICIAAIVASLVTSNDSINWVLRYYKFHLDILTSTLMHLAMYVGLLVLFDFNNLSKLKYVSAAKNYLQFSIKLFGKQRTLRITNKKLMIVSTLIIFSMMYSSISYLGIVGIIISFIVATLMPTISYLLIVESGVE